MSMYPAPTPTDPASTPAVVSTTDTTQLAARIAALESRVPETSWLFGPSFLKRVFAIWGHYFVAQLIIGIVLFVLFFACTLLFGGLIAGLSNR